MISGNEYLTSWSHSTSHMFNFLHWKTHKRTFLFTMMALRLLLSCVLLTSGTKSSHFTFLNKSLINVFLWWQITKLKGIFKILYEIKVFIPNVSLPVFLWHINQVFFGIVWVSLQKCFTEMLPGFFTILINVFINVISQDLTELFDSTMMEITLALVIV